MSLTRVGSTDGKGAWVWRAVDAAGKWHVGKARCVDAPRGVHEVHAEIWAPFPRMARGKGAPRGRRVETVLHLLSNTTNFIENLKRRFGIQLN